MPFPSIESCVGNTPLVRLQRLPGETTNVILAKLEGDNPAGSVKDRPALNMIRRAEERGEIRRGDTLIEATSGSTGIALVDGLNGRVPALSRPLLPSSATEPHSPPGQLPRQAGQV